jgi:hypothetical protein
MTLIKYLKPIHNNHNTIIKLKYEIAITVNFRIVTKLNNIFVMIRRFNY